jgi:hypothetical protein
MLTYREAMETLRLSQDTAASDEDIEKAFRKLRRRYPPEQFPEKFQRVRESYSLLKQSDDYWRSLIEQDVNLGWLAPFVQNASAQEDANVQPEVDRQRVLESLARGLLPQMFDDEDLFDLEALARLLEEAEW